jgi:hypothetical protein
MTDVPEVAEYQIALLNTFPMITNIYAEFIGDIDPDWNMILNDLNTDVSGSTWDLPNTDQEIFSKKKNISYLRLTYSIRSI